MEEPLSVGFFVVFRKPPARPGGSEKLIAMSLEKITPFDYNKFAATNCKK